MRHHDDRRSETGAQIEDQLVETARGDRVQAGRRLVEKKKRRVEGHRACQRSSLLHAAAELRWLEIIEAAETDESQLEPSDPLDFAGREGRILGQRKGHIFQQGHRAEKRAALVKHSNAPEHSLALRLLGRRDAPVAIVDLPGGRVLEPQQVSQAACSCRSRCFR